MLNSSKFEFCFGMLKVTICVFERLKYILPSIHIQKYCFDFEKTDLKLPQKEEKNILFIHKRMKE